MKLALLLPGYIESPDYRHLVVIDNKLKELGYTTIRVDACDLWKTGDGQNYTTTNYINQVKEIIDSYLPQNPTEIILIGHSLGTLVAAHLANIYSEITKIICLCPPISLDRSDHKWINGVRISKKDLPNDPNSFREFSVPFSFVEDRKQYSLANNLKTITKPTLIITGTDDPSVSEVRDVVEDFQIKDYLEIEGMGHDFRQSEELCNKVTSAICDYLLR